MHSRKFSAVFLASNTLHAYVTVLRHQLSSSSLSSQTKLMSR